MIVLSEDEKAVLRATSEYDVVAIKILREEVGMNGKVFCHTMDTLRNRGLIAGKIINLGNDSYDFGCSVAIGEKEMEKLLS